MTVAHDLVAWALELSHDDIPDRTHGIVRRHVADGIGTAVAARRLHEADSVLTIANRFASTPTASIIGGGSAGVEGAAFANGVLIHALDFDDTHAAALVHVTAISAPAGFAVGETTEASVADVCTAIAIGMEVAARLGMAVSHGFHERGFHATSVVGPLASAIVAARLWNLTIDQAVAALGIAGSMASGSLEFLHTPATTKQLHPGWASLGGLIAAQLSQEGASGPDTIVEGRYGLYRLFTDQEPSLAEITAGLGDRWEAESITIKPYPVCQLTHATLDAAATLPPIDVDDIESISVHLPEGSIPIVASPSAEKVAPTTGYDAKFSAQWDVAALLIDGSVGVDSFTPDQLSRRDIRSLAARVHVVTTDFTGPPASAPGRIQVTTASGTTEIGEVARSHGTPSLPLDDAALQAKLASNMGSAHAARDVIGLLADDSAAVADLLAATSSGVAA